MRSRDRIDAYKGFHLNTSLTGNFAIDSFRGGGIKVIACGLSHPGSEDNQSDEIREDLETVHGIGIVPYSLHLGDGAHEDQTAIDPSVDFEDVGSKDISETEFAIIGPSYQI